MPLVPLCTEESWYQWEDSLSIPTCSINFNTYAFPSCSSLFPLTVPYVSLCFQFIIFSWGWMLSKQRVMENGVAMKTACNGTNRGSVTQWRAISLWSALRIWWKKFLSCSVKLRDLRWQKDRAPLRQAQEFYHSGKLPETATAGWVLRVSCYHPL